MKWRKLLLSGLTIPVFACILPVSTVNADCKILSQDELENISLDDLKKEYQLLADEYSTLLNSSTDSADDSYDINQFAPGTAIKDVYVKLGEPDDMQDMDYFKIYQFIYVKFVCNELLNYSLLQTYLYRKLQNKLVI